MTQEKKLPQAVSESTIEINGHTIRVYQMSDGSRILNAEDVDSFFGGDMTGNGYRSKKSPIRKP